MINRKDTALVVIDVQIGVFNKKIKIFMENELINNINSLIDVFHDKAMPIYFVRHTMINTLAKNSDDWQIHPGLHFQANDVVVDKKHSSVFKEKTLQNELDKAGIKHIVVTGVVTHGCVKAACQGAKKLGYDVTLAGDGHSSFNQNAESLIKEWNEKLATEGVNIIKTCDILDKV